MTADPADWDFLCDIAAFYGFVDQRMVQAHRPDWEPYVCQTFALDLPKLIERRDELRTAYERGELRDPYRDDLSVAEEAVAEYRRDFLDVERAA